ncbi:MFS transporter [Nocardia salmonicida]|uniref:MFS transporter n=1 Tax=Nocardia salmonicida TaxID=53431 RepID=UPI000AFDC3A7|nr:MFS transporter [Nocardia salmonicida]MBC7299804.1 MFS transporter [Nocardia sp.]
MSAHTERGRDISAGQSSRVGAVAGQLARVLAVLALVMFGHIGPGSPTAAAVGFDCKEIPAPELPKAVIPSLFDASSAERPAPTHADPTGYQTYGWAGLRWYTYDLGCGEDLVRAPSSVLDTNYGNTFLTIGESMAAAAFWLDEQTKTGASAQAAGVESALEKFDDIVTSVSRGMVGIYGTWLGIGLSVAGVIMGWQALKSDTAGVTKSAGVGLAAIALGALLVGAPQKAIQVSDDTFGSLITDTQDQMFSVSIDDGGGTLGVGVNDPRNVLLDKIFLDDWRKGWFGANYTELQDRQPDFGFGPKLRDSLAFTYAEQEEIQNNPDAEARIIQAKQDKFRNEVVKPLEEHKLSFYTFQGKESGRAGIGFMAMLKLAMPSILWIGASLLKLTALLAIRFAILFAPIWIPIAAAHGGMLSRVLRTLATAYMWGVAGAVIVGLYLIALVRLYVTDNGIVDGAWRLWFMILLTAICWFIMRPFKRMSQTISGNQASLINRKARGAQQSMKAAFLRRAGAALGGGPAGVAAEKAVSQFSKGGARRGGDETLDNDTVRPVRPEGRDLTHRRQADVSHARSDARKHLHEQSRRSQSAKITEARDARIAGIAASASAEMARGISGGGELGKTGKNGKPGMLDDAEAARAVEYGAAALRRFDEENTRSREEQEDRPVTPQVSQRWDGGDGSVIAPMKVYTPTRGSNTLNGVVPMVAISSPVRSTQRAEPPARPRHQVWDPPPPNGNAGQRQNRRLN